MNEGNECLQHQRLRNIKRDMSQEIEKRKQFNLANVTGFYMTNSKPTERKKRMKKMTADRWRERSENNSI